jgi:cytochrome c-type biogenesis protein CcmH/NrfG
MATASPPTRWLYGPLPDLLLGCGLWYLLAFLAFAAAGAEIRTAGGPLLLPFLLLVFSTPHYGATLLRVYEQRQDRRAYAFFAVYTTAVLLAIFMVGVHNGLVGSIILTVYFTWSPWHYTGQNYGIAVMFLRRRGVDLPPRVKRFIYASFILSYVMTFLALHSGAPAGAYAPVSYEDARYTFLSLGIPASVSAVAFAAAALAYAVALTGAAVLLLRRASPRDLGPVAGLAVSQALWFSIPLALRHWHFFVGIEPLEDDFSAHYFLWIAIGHAVQYVWITSYYAKVGSTWTGYFRYFAKAMLAGALIWTLPGVLFAPQLLGRLPFEAGLGILVAATVNIHHFILDGAIWKLRDGRVARVLIRERPPEESAPSESRGRSRVAPVVWAMGFVCLAILFGAKWEREVEVRRALAERNFARVRTAMDRLSWVGRDSPKLHLTLAQILARGGNNLYATVEYEQSIAIYPSAEAWFGLGTLHMKLERWSRAAEAFEATVELDPEKEQAYYGLGITRMQLSQAALARDAFEASVELDPENEQAYFGLGIARMQLSQPALAGDAFERAVALNPERKINHEMLERANEAVPKTGDVKSN